MTPLDLINTDTACCLFAPLDKIVLKSVLPTCRPGTRDLVLIVLLIRLHDKNQGYDFGNAGIVVCEHTEKL